MSYPATKTHGGNRVAHHSVGEASLRSRRRILFQLRDIPEKAKCGQSEETSGSQSWRRVVGGKNRWEQRTFRAMGTSWYQLVSNSYSNHNSTFMKFPKLITDTKAHIQGAQRIPHRSHTHTLTHTQPYNLGTSYLKQTMLGKCQRKHCLTHRGKNTKIMAEFLS